MPLVSLDGPTPESDLLWPMYKPNVDNVLQVRAWCRDQRPKGGGKRVRRRLVSIVLMAALLTACSKPGPDGFATEGGIHPVSNAIGDVIETEQLTDASALLTALRSIRDQAPPQDYANENSMATRRSFYRKRLLSLLPEKESVLISLGCVGAENSALTFDPNTRNLVVEISSFSPRQAQAFREEVRRHLQQSHEMLLEDQLFVLRTGRSMLRNGDLDFPKERESLLGDFNRAAQIRPLPAGPRMAVLNNPVSRWHLDLSIALNEAGYEHLQFTLAILKDQQPRPGSFAAIFDRAKESWSRYPLTETMEPFFYKRIPHADPAEGLCLIGAFKGVDLRLGGELEIAMLGESDLTGYLDAWFIINRSNGQVLYRERAPQENSSQ